MIVTSLLAFQDHNAGTVLLLVISLFGHMSFSEGGQQLRRFVYSGSGHSSGHSDPCHNHCGGHGTCVRQQKVHHDYYYNCQCDNGWYGIHCNMQYTTTQAIHCHNTYCMHGFCVYSRDDHGHSYNYHCDCKHGWKGAHCDQQLKVASSTTKQTTSTPTPTTTSKSTTTISQTVSTPSTSSAEPLPTLLSCNHVNTITAVAYQSPVANQNATECSTGNHASHEAFILTECAVPQNPSSWKWGINVMSRCSSSAALPDLTPIATFDYGLYSSVGSQSGIFLGCTNSGFKIALQTCDQPPHIVELELGGSNTNNPNMYYTIS